MTPMQTNRTLARAEAFSGRRQVRRSRKLRKPGRPKVGGDPKRDGERLQAALNAYGIKSQAEAARRTSISQRNLNQIIQGKRSISREELRAISKHLGIPADYVLGTASRLAPPDATRTRAELAADLVEHIKVAAADSSTIPEEWVRDAVVASVDGAVLLSQLEEGVRKELAAVAAAFRKMASIGFVHEKIKDEGLRARLRSSLAGAWLPQLGYLKLSPRAFQRLAEHIVTGNQPLFTKNRK